MSCKSFAVKSAIRNAEKQRDKTIKVLKRGVRDSAKTWDSVSKTNCRVSRYEKTGVRVEEPGGAVAL